MQLQPELSNEHSSQTGMCAHETRHFNHLHWPLIRDSEKNGEIFDTAYSWECVGLGPQSWIWIE